MAESTGALAIEIRRKLIHFPALVIPFGIYFFPAWFSVPTLFIVAVLCVTVEVLRFRSEKVQALFYKYFGSLLRTHESNRITGSTALLLSASVCLLFFLEFDSGLAISSKGRLSMFYAFSFLILGDAFAAVVGKKVGGIKIWGGKTLSGTLACFLTCCTIYFACNGNVVSEIAVSAAIAGAFLTAFLESAPVPLDDNLRVAPAVCLVIRMII